MSPAAKRTRLARIGLPTMPLLFWESAMSSFSFGFSLDPSKHRLKMPWTIRGGGCTFGDRPTALTSWSSLGWQWLRVSRSGTPGSLGGPCSADSRAIGRPVCYRNFQQHLLSVEAVFRAANAFVPDGYVALCDGLPLYPAGSGRLCLDGGDTVVIWLDALAPPAFFRIHQFLPTQETLSGSAGRGLRGDNDSHDAVSVSSASPLAAGAATGAGRSRSPRRTPGPDAHPAARIALALPTWVLQRQLPWSSVVVLGLAGS